MQTYYTKQPQLLSDLLAARINEPKKSQRKELHDQFKAESKVIDALLITHDEWCIALQNSEINHNMKRVTNV